MYRLQMTGPWLYARRYERWLDWIIPHRIGPIYEVETIKHCGLEVQLLICLHPSMEKTQCVYLFANGNLIGPFDKEAFSNDYLYALDIGRETMREQEESRRIVAEAEKDRRAELVYEAHLIEQAHEDQIDREADQRDLNAFCHVDGGVYDEDPLPPNPFFDPNN